MKKSLSKTQAKSKIEEFFEQIRSKTPKEIKMIQKLAKKYNIPLREKKKTFCKKCLSPYINPKIRVNKKIKRVICKECGGIVRWKL